MAKNLIFNGCDGLAVVCSDPATPASGDPVRFGERCGVAQANEQSDGKTVVDFTPGRGYDLSVKAVDGGGNSAVAFGDKLYYVDADTPKLSKKSTGRFFGYALETITSGSTDTINVMLA
jgi:predicted RecA/RadA family phage recombinase